MSFDCYPIIALLIAAIPEALLATLGWYFPALPLVAFWLFMRLKVRRVILSASAVASFLDALWCHSFPSEVLAIVLIAFFVLIWVNYGDLYSYASLFLAGIFCGICIVFASSLRVSVEMGRYFGEVYTRGFVFYTATVLAKSAVLAIIVAYLGRVFWPFGDSSVRRRH